MSIARSSTHASPGAALSAARVVAREPEHVYAFLARLSNHGRLADRHMRLSALDVERERARIVLRAPFGIRRTARTAVTHRHPTRAWGGVAAVGSRTRAAVVWRVEPHDGGSLVVLRADVTQAAFADRVLLALGGRRWLRRRFRSALAGLAAALDGDREAASQARAGCPVHAAARA